MNELVHTGDIEVVSERAARTTRPQIARRPVSYGPVVRPAPLALLPEPESTTLAIERPPSYPRHSTIVPPSRAPEPSQTESDDEMTVLWSQRSYAGSFTPPPRRSGPWGAPPAPQSRRAATEPPRSRDLEGRFAVTGPAMRRTEWVLSRPQVETVPALAQRAPDSLRPVEMPSLAADADASGKHDPAPTSVTMRTHVLTGRPTFTWAAALVLLGAAVGIGTSVYANDAGKVTSRVATTSFVAPERGAASQPRVETPWSEAPALRHEPSSLATPVSTHVDAPAAETAPLAALADSRVHAEASPPQRPTWVAPPAAAPTRRWAMAPRPVVAAPPVAAAPVPAPLPDAAPIAAAAPAPAKASTKTRTRRGADADLQAASASDALARAQLEAALR